jgi:hypothetical protein
MAGSSVAALNRFVAEWVTFSRLCRDGLATRLIEQLICWVQRMHQVLADALSSAVSQLRWLYSAERSSMTKLYVHTASGFMRRKAVLDLPYSQGRHSEAPYFTLRGTLALKAIIYWRFSLFRTHLRCLFATVETSNQIQLWDLRFSRRWKCTCWSSEY